MEACRRGRLRTPPCVRCRVSGPLPSPRSRRARRPVGRIRDVVERRPLGSLVPGEAVVDGAWVRMVWHTHTFVTHQLDATRELRSRAEGRRTRRTNRRFRGNLPMCLTSHADRRQPMDGRELGPKGPWSRHSEQRIVGHGGAPTAKRGRTTLRRDHLGATTDEDRSYGRQWCEVVDGGGDRLGVVMCCGDSAEGAGSAC
jgi:hypothetical protein